MSSDPSVPDVGQSAALRGLHVELIRFGRSLHLLKQSAVQNGGYSASAPILARLRDHGPMRSRQLAELIMLDPSTVSRQVDQLVKAGLVQRIADPDDGRATLLELSAAGLRALDEHAARINGLLEQVLHDWTVEQIEALVTSLAHLNHDSAERLPGLLEASRRSA